MYSCFGYDVGVESIAEVDRIDVIAVPQKSLSVLVAMCTAPKEGMSIPFQIAVHDGEKDLQEQVDRV